MYRMEEILSKYKVKHIAIAFDEAIESSKIKQPYLKTGIAKLDKVVRVEVNRLVPQDNEEIQEEENE